MSQDIELKPTPQERIANALERIANVQEALLKSALESKAEKVSLSKQLASALKRDRE